MRDFEYISTGMPHGVATFTVRFWEHCAVMLEFLDYLRVSCRGMNPDQVPSMGLGFEVESLVHEIEGQEHDTLTVTAPVSAFALLQLQYKHEPVIRLMDKVLMNHSKFLWDMAKEEAWKQQA